MTTDEEIAKKTRTIDELIRLGTYQDMTDEEINRLIEYKAKVAADRADSEARAREAEAQLKAMQEESAKTREQAEEAFKRACSLNPGFASVCDG